MNLRYEILRAVSKNPGAPAAEICDVIDYDRQKTTWSVRDCAKAGLLAMRRDDVTGQPGYTLTEAGKERLADGPTKQGGNAKHSQPAVEQNTGSSASDTCTSPAEGAAVQAQPAPDPAADVSAAAPVAADEMQDDEIPPADASLLALANRELADRLARVAHVLRGSGLEALKNLADGADLQSAAAAVTGAYQMALGDLHAFTGKIADLQHKVSMQDAKLFKQAGVIVDLRNQLGEARAAHHALQESPTLESIEPAGYLVRATKRKPRTLLAEDKAREAALSSVRAGALRAEVFALVPVGQARRGAEWRSA